MKQDQIDRMKNQIKEDLKNTTKEELIKVYKTSKTFTTFAAISFAAGSIILAMNSLMFIGLVSLFVSYIWAKARELFNNKMNFIEEVSTKNKDCEQFDNSMFK